jgi:hypothetical protein
MRQLRITAEWLQRTAIAGAVLTIASASTVANAAPGAAVSADVGPVLGVWKGSSVCQIKDSPCHDESAVYYATKGAEPGTFQMKMNKVVGGEEQTMGTIDCSAGAESGSYVCRPNDSTMWTWKLEGDVLSGTLQFRGQLYRKIRVTRAK